LLTHPLGRLSRSEANRCLHQEPLHLGCPPPLGLVHPGPRLHPGCRPHQGRMRLGPGRHLHQGCLPLDLCLLRALTAASLGDGAPPPSNGLLVKLGLRPLCRPQLLWAPFQPFPWSTPTACALARRAVFTSCVTIFRPRLPLSPLFRQRIIELSMIPCGVRRWRTCSKPSPPTTLGLLFRVCPTPTSSPTNGFLNTSSTPTDPSSATKRVGPSRVHSATWHRLRRNFQSCCETRHHPHRPQPGSSTGLADPSNRCQQCFSPRYLD
jgi:hypothetical protein